MGLEANYRRWGLAGLALIAFATWAWVAHAETEDWKGNPDLSEFTFSLMTGAGIIDSSVGLAVAGAASKKIVRQGFVPDINNTVFIEALLGPVFVAGSAQFSYSTHLRWDFIRDEEWTFYALGGLGGYFTGQSMGNQSLLYPRFGSGVFWNISEYVTLRGELSHEFMVLGGMIFL